MEIDKTKIIDFLINENKENYALLKYENVFADRLQNKEKTLYKLEYLIFGNSNIQDKLYKLKLKELNKEV